MKTKRSVRLSLLAGAVACAALAAMPGCELIVDFDRSKIPTGDDASDDGSLPGDDATLGDGGSTPDGGADGSSSADGSTGPDGATGLDSGSDADAGSTPSDAGQDSGPGLDASDTGAPLADTGVDAPSEASSEPDSSVPAEAGDD